MCVRGYVRGRGVLFCLFRGSLRFDGGNYVCVWGVVYECGEIIFVVISFSRRVFDRKLCGCVGSFRRKYCKMINV